MWRGRRVRFRWFGHLKSKSVDDRVSACGNVEMTGVRCREGIGRENV